jgi:hypothetical protein
MDGQETYHTRARDFEHEGLPFDRDGRPRQADPRLAVGRSFEPGLSLAQPGREGGELVGLGPALDEMR